MARSRFCKEEMGFFDLKLYHGGRIDYGIESIRYVGGETTIIAEMDSDWWSLYEAYSELRHLGYPRGNISSLWYKDPALPFTDENLMSFSTDVDSEEMY
ncbi:hypothetical protein PIB30_048769 [Stylosanthes scabra]|uniref:PB1-like domain-containing protein n=1 Tax=Stylosanthes scabra TaxID=79078 RepID=A0ABU6TGW2_9FABA|nr:hypothetical protein [Stylosanthes scabra]